MSEILTIPRWVWWQNGECVVEVLRRGHFPSSVMCKLPDDRVIEIELEELKIFKG